jgi:cytochrome P450
MPNDLLSIMVQHPGHYDEFGPDTANREASGFLVATVGSTVNAICFAVHDLDEWLATHAEDRARRTDRSFLQRCFAESLRLGQVNTILRMAVEDVTLPSGVPFPAGHVAIIDRPSGNSSLERDGESAVGERAFDPDRVLRNGVAQFGLAFGGGPHMCIGKDFAVGGFPRASSADASDNLGVGVRIFALLQEWDAVVVPEGTEFAEEMVGRPTWKRLLVSCDPPESIGPGANG